MSGQVLSIDERGCRGWAHLPGMPRYAATIHIILDGVVSFSGLADRVGVNESEPLFGEIGWFHLPMPADVLDRRRDISVLIGETGEVIDPRRSATVGDVSSDGSNRRAPAEAIKTYRDGLAAGLDAVDILELFYLDILRRPIDREGLRSQITALRSGGWTYDAVRTSLLTSAEYATLKLSARDAPGRIFARPIVMHSANRRRAFETQVTAFQTSKAPLSEKLVCFFPGLQLRPASLAVVERAAQQGLPAREIFSRALSLISDRPSLIPHEFPPPARSSSHDSPRHPTAETARVTITASSSLFACGWNDLEGDEGAPRRWMSQIGIILNPHPERPVESVEVEVLAWYGALDKNVLAVSEREPMLVTRRETESGSVVLALRHQTKSLAKLDYVALLAAEASSPSRYDGTQDPRLLSFIVARAVFNFGTAGSE